MDEITDAKRLRSHAAWLRDGDLGGGEQAERDAQLCERAAAVLERERLAPEHVSALVSCYTHMATYDATSAYSLALAAALAALGVKP